MLQKESQELELRSNELARLAEDAQRDTKRNYVLIERKQAQVDMLNRKVCKWRC